MNKKKILLIVGTRPEAIKMAPLAMEFKKQSEHFETKLCSTGQHREMLNQVLNLFDLKPDYGLGLMKPSQTLGDLTARALTSVTKVLDEFRPDFVLVQGDTTTAMACAMASFYKKIPVGHVEAGLRTNNIYSPFPEEINRRVISQVASFHFAPTQRSVDALRNEGVQMEKIFKTGNTVIDALYWILENKPRLPEDLNLNGHRLILITAHRRENFGRPLIQIAEGIVRLIELYDDIQIAYPVHKNPNVWYPIHKILDGRERIKLLPPVDYDELVSLMKESYLILTDSGGIQEEAPALGKPVLVLRTETERPEAIEAGIVKLVGTDSDNIVKETEILINNEYEYAKRAKAVSPYGDGHAAKRIVEIILRYILTEAEGRWISGS